MVKFSLKALWKFSVMYRRLTKVSLYSLSWLYSGNSQHTGCPTPRALVRGERKKSIAAYETLQRCKWLREYESGTSFCFMRFSIYFVYIYGTRRLYETSRGVTPFFTQSWDSFFSKNMQFRIVINSIIIERWVSRTFSHVKTIFIYVH